MDICSLVEHGSPPTSTRTGEGLRTVTLKGQLQLLYNIDEICKLCGPPKIRKRRLCNGSVSVKMETKYSHVN